MKAINKMKALTLACVAMAFVTVSSFAAVDASITTAVGDLEDTFDAVKPFVIAVTVFVLGWTFFKKMSRKAG